MVVVGLKRSKIREIQPKADISKLGYVRWPRILADCDIPDEWKAIDLKLFALLVQKRNKKDPYGVTRMPVRDARKFLGATKLEIMDSMCRLMDHKITVTYPESDPQEIAVLFPNGMYLAEGRSTPYVTGVWGTEVCWKFMPEVVGMLDDNSHYGRVHLETVRKLESLAAVKLFMKFAEVKHSMTGGGGYWQRTMNELMTFLGCARMISKDDKPSRVDNFRNLVLEPAMAQIKATNAYEKLLDHKSPRSASGRGRRISFIDFWFVGTGFGKPLAPGTGARSLAELLAAADLRESKAAVETPDPVPAAEPVPCDDPVDDILGQIMADDFVAGPPEFSASATRYFGLIETQARYYADLVDEATSDEARVDVREHSENLYATLAEVKHAARTNPHWRAPPDLRGIDIFTGRLMR